MAKPFVVKLAQPGIDVKTAGDENLVYNSNWPLLKIYKQGSFTTNSGNGLNQLVVNHGLGYPPAFWFFANTDIRNWNFAFGPQSLDNRAEFNGPLEDFPTINDQILYYGPSGFINDYGIQKFHYYIFALDLSKPYTAPKIRSGGVIGPRNKRTIFKISKPNKDVSSSRLEDYVVHSNARSPLIHAVVPYTVSKGSEYVSGEGFTYYHNLGYAPMFFVYGRANPTFFSGAGVNDYYMFFTDGTISGFSVDETKIVYDSLGELGNHFSLLVLKDPFNVNYIRTVNV